MRVPRCKARYHDAEAALANINFHLPAFLLLKYYYKNTILPKFWEIMYLLFIILVFVEGFSLTRFADGWQTLNRFLLSAYDQQREKDSRLP